MSAIPPATRSRGNSSRTIPNASGKIAPPRPWIDAGADHHRERRREGRDQRSGGEAGEHDDERALLAEHVAEASGDRRRHRGRQEVRGEDPGHACRRRVEVLLENGQRRHDERLQHRVGAAAEGEDGEDAAGVSRGRGVRLAR